MVDINKIFEIIGIKEDYNKPYIITLNNGFIENNPKINKISLLTRAVLLKNNDECNIDNKFS